MSRIANTLGILLLLIVVLAACSGGGDEGADAEAAIPGGEVQAASVDVAADAPVAQNEAADQAEAGPQAQATSTGDREPALPLTDDGEQIVATVNGEPITLTEFQRTFDRYQLQSSAASFDALAAVVMDTLIQQRLINQAAVEMGITVTEEEIAAEFARNRGESTSDEEWEAWLEVNLYTEDELRSFLRDWLLTQRVQELVVQVEFAEIDEVRARHIVVASEAEAQSVLERLQTGEDFVALAAEVSRDVTTRDDGGDLGWFTLDSLLTPELAEAAFGLEPGQITGPVETMLGYHVLELLERRSREAAPDEAYAAAARQFEAWLETLDDDADIARYINY